MGAQGAEDGSAVIAHETQVGAGPGEIDTSSGVCKKMSIIG
jgi:hypothetical protein